MASQVFPTHTLDGFPAQSKRPVQLVAWQVRERWQQNSSANPFPSVPPAHSSSSTCHCCGYCWLLGFCLALCSRLWDWVPGLKQRQCEGLGGLCPASSQRQPHRCWPWSAASPSQPPLAAPAALPGCQECFCWLAAEVGRGGIQEAASRLILLIICSLKDRAENWHRKRWCCGFLWHLNFILVLIFAYQLLRKEGEEEGQRLCGS